MCIARTTLRFSIFIFLSCAALVGNAQIEYADRVVEAFYSGSNPDFSTFYGNNPTTDGCNLVTLSPDVVLGNNDTIVALPTGSFITLAFEDNLVFDAPGQDDLFIEEIGGGQEFGDLFVSPDGMTFTLLDSISGANINSFDLAEYPYDDVIKFVKIVGLNEGGCIPGLDIARVFGVPGANCYCGAKLMDFPHLLCPDSDTLIDLDLLVLDETDGKWIGPGVIDSTFNPQGLEGEVSLGYIVNFGHPVCPADTVDYTLRLQDCDCLGEVNGSSVIDECGLCLTPTDPGFNMSCLDCAGVPNGPARIDVCGVCLDTTDMLFDQTCFDCNGVEGGPAILDICDNCLEPDDPEFNLNCPERFNVYAPTIIDMNSFTGNDEFGLYGSDENIAFVESFEVYDRWGSLVFEVREQALVDVDRWWDGRRNGKELDQGLYTVRYHLSYPIDIPDDYFVTNVVLIR